MASLERKIPTVLTSEELMDKAYSRAAKITKNGTNALDGKKKTTLAKVTASGDIVVTTLNGYVSRFPRIDKEDDFFPQLVDLVIGIDRYKKALGALNWAAGRTDKLKNESLREIRRSKDISYIDSTRNSFYGRMSSYIRQISKDLLFLQEAKNKFRHLPAIQPDIPTIVVAGFPNVGKSSLVKAMSTAAPEIAPYPFTTKGIIIGHIEDDWRKFQIIDTPGLLDRSFEERNDIEKQAVLALRYLTNIMIFILDPSETCGYSMEKQTALLRSIQEGFVGVDIIVAESKSDILRTNSGNLFFSAQTGENMEEIRGLIISKLRALVVSEDE
ncbi:MAG: NOG1 family protein [Candidatus Methanomethylophilaceae archaeon]|nr:nucleolar GTP-binding protein [Candidatus Methanomethylophilaceae archaeon]